MPGGWTQHSELQRPDLHTNSKIPRPQIMRLGDTKSNEQCVPEDTEKKLRFTCTKTFFDRAARFSHLHFRV